MHLGPVKLGLHLLSSHRWLVAAERFTDQCRSQFRSFSHNGSRVHERASRMDEASDDRDATLATNPKFHHTNIQYHTKHTWRGALPTRYYQAYTIMKLVNFFMKLDMTNILKDNELIIFSGERYCRWRQYGNELIIQPGKLYCRWQMSWLSSLVNYTVAGDSLVCFADM